MVAQKTLGRQTTKGKGLNTDGTDAYAIHAYDKTIFSNNSDQAKLFSMPQRPPFTPPFWFFLLHSQPSPVPTRQRCR